MKENKLEELIKKLCPNGVEYKKLEDCCNILDNERKPVTKSARIKGEYPYYGANGIQDYVSDYIFDGIFVLVGEDGSVINKNGNPVVTWAEGKIWVNNHAHVMKEKENVLLRYLYHYIQTINVSVLIHGNIPKLNQGDFRNLRIPVPPLEVQCEIVHILDNFTLLSAELSAELKARQKQYEFYSKNLFDFNDEVDWVNLEFIAEIGTGSSNTNEAVENGKYPFYVRSQQVYYKNDYEYDDNSIITSGDGVGVGKIFHYTNGKYALHQRAYRIHIIDSKVNSKYFYYYMKSTFYDYIQKNAFNSSVTSIRRPMLNKYPIPVPSLEKQNKVVDILDRFDKLCNDISEGLPAEIEARQRQYEYYRDKLLTFKELKVNE